MMLCSPGHRWPRGLEGPGEKVLLRANRWSGTPFLQQQSERKGTSVWAMRPEGNGGSRVVRWGCATTPWLTGCRWLPGQASLASGRALLRPEHASATPGLPFLPRWAQYNPSSHHRSRLRVGRLVDQDGDHKSGISWARHCLQKRNYEGYSPSISSGYV